MIHVYDPLYAAQTLLPSLEQRALETERLRRLPDATLADLRSSGLLTLLRPCSQGGREATFEACLQITGMLAAACASTAWVYGNFAFNQWMLALWPEAAQREVWEMDDTALVGSALTFPHGQAEPVDGGYTLTGCWQFSSGIDACGWALLGGIVAGADGELPDYRVFLVPSSDYRVEDTWHAAGLKGSGSNSLSMKSAFVPHHRSVSIDELKSFAAPGLQCHSGGLYRAPGFDLFPSIAAAVAQGTAKGAVTAFASETRHRVTSYTTTLMADHATTQVRLGEAGAAVDTAETLILTNCRRACEDGLERSLSERVILRRDAAYAARLCCHAVDILFEASGGDSLYDTRVMQRAFRDVHAVQSHYLLAWDVAAASAGRSLLGIPPDLPAL
jgi:3-hydroxy-9,10-secoandrosta-1,3,5(10)-triene-9,17-dione monooxygenase